MQPRSDELAEPPLSLEERARILASGGSLPRRKTRRRE
jgi:hypothetical protein